MLSVRLISLHFITSNILVAQDLAALTALNCNFYLPLDSLNYSGFCLQEALFLHRFSSVSFSIEERANAQGEEWYAEDYTQWASVFIGIWPLKSRLSWKLFVVFKQLFSLFTSASMVETLVFSDFFLLRAEVLLNFEKYPLWWLCYHLTLFVFLKSFPSFPKLILWYSLQIIL